MIIKATVLGCALVSTPLCLTSLPQDPTQVPVRDAVEEAAPEPDTSGEIRELRAQIRKLQGQIEVLDRTGGELRGEVRTSQAEVAATKAQLAECMDLLERSTERTRGNCTPSRTRKLLTHYQWMQGNGHPKRAGRLLGKVVEESGKNNSHLNSLAWNLMTSKETSGKFDAAALALAARMEENGRLRHNQLDTLALAKFLNGDVQAAVASQQSAIKAGGNSDEYRRRLRVYQAALARTLVVEKAEAADTAPAARDITAAGGAK